MSDGRPFYVTGGSLHSDTPSYVRRRADTELYDALNQGEFCYILTPRQMGKSSLTVRTAVRLQADGVDAVVLDLTAIGQNVDAEQWYYGLLSRIGERLDIEEDLDDFWSLHEALGPLQRFMAALRRVVLRRVRGRIVIFIDEIDVVLSLPFSTDELFAAIREFYNRRTADEELQRLTFCLLGVAAPTDLILDTRMTPFNIGRRIELTDFTNEEAAHLAEGLYPQVAQMDADRERNPQIAQISQRDAERGEGSGEAHSHRKSEIDNLKLLVRVLYWTGGHPYLTQRLCLAVARERVEDRSRSEPAPPDSTARDVDRKCESLFLSHRAQERDDNLIFVRERILRTGTDLASLLELYLQVWRGRCVPDDDTDPLAGFLRLSGIARVAGGRLRVRNRIYARVFDGDWVRSHMPDAELQRQRRAFRQGVMRTLVIAGAIVAAMSLLAFSALRSAREAENRERDSIRNLYVADMNLATAAIAQDNLPRAEELIEAHRPSAAHPQDLRGFEWRYIWKRCRGDQLLFLAGGSRHVLAVATSPDGSTLASHGEDGVIRLLDAASGRLRGTIHRRMKTRAETPDRSFLAFSPDGNLLASSGWDGDVELWSVRTLDQVAALHADEKEARNVVFFRDGRRLATCGADIKIWDIASKSIVEQFRANASGSACVQISPDERTIATGGGDGFACLWDLRSHKELHRFRDTAGAIYSVAFSPDGRTLAAGDFSTEVRIWDTRTGALKGVLRGQLGQIVSVQFSPNGKVLASASDDGTVRLWDAAADRSLRTLLGHRAGVHSVSFTRDAKRIATAGDDGTIGLWDAAPAPYALALHTRTIYSTQFSPDGKLLATGSDDGTASLVDVGLRRRIGLLNAGSNCVMAVAFSPDGKTLAMGTGSWDRADEPSRIVLWDVTSRPVRKLGALCSGRGAVTSLAYSPDGRLLASGSNNGSVVLWDTRRRCPLTTLKGPEAWKNEVVFSPDRCLLAMSNPAQDRFDLWNVAGDRPTLVESLPYTGGGNCIGFSPDGRLFAYDDTPGIRLVEIATKRTRGILAGHVGLVCAMAFTPDGQNVATGSWDGTARLWSLKTMTEVGEFRSPSSGVTALAFRPDGNLLVTGHSDGSARFLEAAPFSETDVRR